MHKRDKTGTMRLLCHIVPVSVIPLPPGVYFGIKFFSPPDPAPVWLELPPRVKMILKDGQDCRNRAAKLNPPHRLSAALLAPSSEAAKQFTDLRLYLLHRWFVHIELHLRCGDPLVDQRRKLLHDLMSKRVDRGVHISSKLLNVDLVIGIVAVRHACLKL